MTTAKQKDDILAKLKDRADIRNIAGINDYIFELEHDGYIRVIYAEGHCPIAARLTPLGEHFISNGGYSLQSKRQKARRVGLSLSRIAEGVAIAIISGYCGWLLRGCLPEDKVASSQPEPSEHHVFKNDSVRLSFSSSLLLNDDNVASRAKSFTVISDNSANTRRIDVTPIPLIEMSALQSSIL